MMKKGGSMGPVLKEGGDKLDELDAVTEAGGDKEQQGEAGQLHLHVCLQWDHILLNN